MILLYQEWASDINSARQGLLTKIFKLETKDYTSDHLAFWIMNARPYRLWDAIITPHATKKKKEKK